MSEIALERSDSGKAVEARAGDTIVIRLEENVSTGYSWEVETSGSPTVELLNSEFLAPDRERHVGGGGVRSIHFRAKSAGSERIQVVLRRSWESGDSAIDRFVADVRVVTP